MLRTLVLSAVLLAAGCMDMEMAQQPAAAPAAPSYTCGKCGGTYLQPQNCPKCGLELSPVQGTSTPPQGSGFIKRK